MRILSVVVIIITDPEPFPGRRGHVTDPAWSLVRQVHPSGPAAAAGWVIGGAG